MLPTDRVSTWLQYTKTRESGAVHSTDTWDGLEIWEMKQETNGLISLRSKNHGKTLESDSKGNVYVTDRFRESELWKLEYIYERCDLHMKSAKHGRSSCCHDDSNLSKQYWGTGAPRFFPLMCGFSYHICPILSLERIWEITRLEWLSQPMLEIRIGGTAVWELSVVQISQTKSWALAKLRSHQHLESNTIYSIEMHFDPDYQNNQYTWCLSK